MVDVTIFIRHENLPTLELPTKTNCNARPLIPTISLRRMDKKKAENPETITTHSPQDHSMDSQALQESITQDSTSSKTRTCHWIISEVTSRISPSIFPTMRLFYVLPLSPDVVATKDGRPKGRHGRGERFRIFRRDTSYDVWKRSRRGKEKSYRRSASSIDTTLPSWGMTQFNQSNSLPIKVFYG